MRSIVSTHRRSSASTAADSRACPTRSRTCSVPVSASAADPRDHVRLRDRLTVADRKRRVVVGAAAQLLGTNDSRGTRSIAASTRSSTTSRPRSCASTIRSWPRRGIRRHARAYGRTREVLRRNAEERRRDLHDGLRLRLDPMVASDLRSPRRNTVLPPRRDAPARSANRTRAAGHDHFAAFGC